MKPIDPIAYAWAQIHGTPLPPQLFVDFGRAISKGTGPRGTGKKPTGSTFNSNPEKGVR